jgi:hypothetical protein
VVLLANRYVFIDITGQTGRLDIPILMVWPVRKGSVLEIFMRTDMDLGEAQLGKKVMSSGER